MSYKPLTDEQWEDIAWLIPIQETGRPRGRDREIFEAISYVLSTGCRWEELPDRFPPKSTVHKRFQIWSEAGFFEKAFRRLRWSFPPSSVYHLDASAKSAKKGGQNRQGLGMARH